MENENLNELPDELISEMDFVQLTKNEEQRRQQQVEIPIQKEEKKPIENKIDFKPNDSDLKIAVEKPEAPKVSLEKKDILQLLILIAVFAIGMFVIVPLATKGIDINAFVIILVLLTIIVVVETLFIMKSGGWFWAGIKLWLNKKSNVFLWIAKNSRAYFEISKQEEVMPFRKGKPEKNIRVDEQEAIIDGHSGRPFYLMIEDGGKNVNPLKEWKPDAANQNINREMQQIFWTGMQIGRRSMGDLNKLLMIFVILGAIFVLVGGAAAYLAFDNAKKISAMGNSIDVMTSTVTNLDQYIRVDKNAWIIPKSVGTVVR